MKLSKEEQLALVGTTDYKTSPKYGWLVAVGTFIGQFVLIVALQNCYIALAPDSGGLWRFSGRLGTLGVADGRHLWPFRRLLGLVVRQDRNSLGAYRRRRFDRCGYDCHWRIRVRHGGRLRNDGPFGHYAGRMRRWRFTQGRHHVVSSLQARHRISDFLRRRLAWRRCLRLCRRTDHHQHGMACGLLYPGYHVRGAWRRRIPFDQKFPGIHRHRAGRLSCREPLLHL